ncbi:MAG: lysylphosphatidylglycerol synthase transmembrane domain-containing protein [Bacteroidales bacterium]|nr:lysylphosphatidylglycerol synthase transmembrane domain-containing protein [Bacteroidales bacterium]
MKQRLISAIKYILLFAAAIILLWFSFREVKWSDFTQGLKSANYTLISVSMVVSIAAFWLRSLRWRMIMLPLHSGIRRVDAWDGINIGYITNFAVPRAGEFARCGVITRKTGLSFEKVAGTVVLERSVDLLSLAVLSTAIFVLQWSRFGNFIDKQILSAFGEKFSAGFGIVAITILAAFAIFFYVVYAFRKKHPVFRKIADIVKGVLAGIVSGFRMKQKWLFIIYTILIWICYWLMSYTTILAFPSVAGLGISDALFLMVIGGFGWAIPVQGGIGAYHFIISLALATIYGIDQTTGVVFATISHGSQALTMIACGIVSLIGFSLFKGKSPSL